MCNTTGYLSIHLLGLSAGTLLLPPSPSYFRKLQRGHNEKPRDFTSTDTPSAPGASNQSYPQTPQRETDKTATEMFSYAVVWWSMLGVTQLLGLEDDISRRLVTASSVSCST